MAGPENRKRQRSHEPSPTIHPPKRAKSAVVRNFSPAFWDNLSKVPLTLRALRELDRRNTTRAALQRKAPCVPPSDQARFARHGGPDLRHLRGYLKSKSSMSPSRSSSSRSQQSQSTKATTNKTRKSSTYGREFQQHLTDHDIYLNNRRSQPKNTNKLQSELALERASLSPSKFSDGAFESFQRSNEDVVFENDVMATVVPVICGTSTSNIPNRQNVLFTELAPIIDEDTVKPKPDFFDGARLQDLGQELRNDPALRSHVIPTKHANVPVAPNFYLEAKGPDGSAAVVQRQACYGAVHGVRAMTALQTFGDVAPTYDGNAYTLSSTYHAGTGTLQLYAHHATAPTTEGGRPEYHMTQIDGWQMTGNIDSFRRGATAFRNARDLAQRQRDAFIKAANARASQAELVAQEVREPTNGTLALESDSANSVNYSARHDADDALQKHVAKSSHYADDETPPPSTPQHVCTEDDSQNPSQSSTALEADDPSMSFASSVTSVSSGRPRSKRPRQPVSPTSVSKEGPASKHPAR